MEFLAHISGSRRQSVHTHLTEVSLLSAQFAAKMNIANAGLVIGLLHDLGKYSSAFQDYLKSAEGLIEPDADDYVDAKGLKGKIDHSTAGAQYVWQKLRVFGLNRGGQGELCGQILALCIASHHSGLIDCIGPDDNSVFENRLDKPDEKTHLEESLRAVDPHLKAKIDEILGAPLVKELFTRLRQIANFDSNLSTIDFFNLGMFTRFLFSCLIDADRLNSAEFEDPARLTARLSVAGAMPWHVAVDRLESYLQGLPTQNYVDALRREISDNCKINAAKPQGIYQLTVPTGGGKTLASLRFALNHAQKHNLERIIYVIPFTSIIEQNAEVIRKVLEAEEDLRPWVLEHHSNLEPEQQNWQSKLVTENWDAPIVLTTMVQLLEVMFNGGTKGVRRLHQLANAVLIFDEIQSLPVNCVHLFCNAMNFLVKECASTVVLCTATQPVLNELKRSDKGELLMAAEPELAGDYQRHFAELRRVEVVNQIKPTGWQPEEIGELLLREFAQTGSCLLIVNTKGWAQQLFLYCQQKVAKEQLFHLSTNQCAAHRKQILQTVKARLANKLPVLCLSTQLIEAGVDVSFSVVVRFLAGLDSIAQAAGRCNRHGTLTNDAGELCKGRVYLINPAAEPVEQLTDIAIGKEKTLRVLHEQHADILAPDVLRQYFRYYFCDSERADEMVYPIPAGRFRADNLLNLLSSRDGCSGRFPNKFMLRHAFMTAGNLFRAIDAPTHAVIVPFGAGKQLIAELCAVAKDFDAKHYYQLLRQAQQFSVNVFPNVWKQLVESGSVYEVQKGHEIYYLASECYDAQFGLNVKSGGMTNLVF